MQDIRYTHFPQIFENLFEKRVHSWTVVAIIGTLHFF